MGTQTRRGQIAKASLVKKIYRVLFHSFGPQGWWPAQTPFEMMVGAILVQNTNWNNTKRVIDHLKTKHLLSPAKLNALNVATLARQIRPAGYFNVKAKRLKHFVHFLFERYQANLKLMRAQDQGRLRAELLKVNGIGPETADSILLYALDKPLFVVDAYTKRVFSRHGLIDKDASYEAVQKTFMTHLAPHVSVYNEYHALIVRVAKEFCRTKPLCAGCPLNIFKPINHGRCS
jgi:endonuclease-3 related protein